MPVLDRDGVRIHYEAEGAGSPILLTHGYGASARMWDGQVAHLRDRHRVITWDMRGHARSDSPADQALYSEEATVGDMAAILDAEGVDSAIIGGLSLGGYMSLAFHLRHPERVRALMLFDTGPGFRKDEAREAWNERVAGRAARIEAEGLAGLGGSREVVGSEHREPLGLARAARGMMAQADSRVFESLATIPVPTLVLVGEEDHGFRDAASYMARKIPNARLEIIPGAGHAANLDRPAEFDAALDAFLSVLNAA